MDEESVRCLSGIIETSAGFGFRSAKRVARFRFHGYQVPQGVVCCRAGPAEVFDFAD